MLGYTRKGRCAYTTPISATAAAQRAARRLPIGRRHLLPDEIDIVLDRAQLVLRLIVHRQRDRPGEPDTRQRREQLAPVHHTFAQRTRHGLPRAVRVLAP